MDALKAPSGREAKAPISPSQKASKINCFMGYSLKNKYVRTYI